MEVKGILDKIRQQDDEKREYCFALEIGEGIVKSAVWLVEKEQIKVVSIGISEDWEKEEELLNAVDATLSSAAESFTPSEEVVEPNKVIFGLSADWIEEEKIVPEKLKILKSLSEKLDLKPVGFVVTNEAIVHYLKTTEGVPPTAILIGLSKSKISLAVLRLGKISPIQLVERSPNIGDDVIEGLSRCEEKEPFPVRILLYNGNEELEEVKQSLVDYSWQEEKVKEKDVTFLHLPKIELLSSDFDIKAVALAGGKEVARAAGIMADFVEKKTEPESLGVEKPETDEEKDFEIIDFGFIKGKDIAEEKKEEVKTEPKEEKIEPEEIKKEVVEKEPAVKVSASVSKRRRIYLPKLKLSFSWLRNINFSRFFSSFSKLFPEVDFGNKKTLVFGGVVAFLLIFGGIAVASYWYLPKASIVLLVEPKVLEEEFEIRLDPTLMVPDKEKLVLPAQKMEQTIDGEKSIETTGTKTVGEKARGEVTIYNRTANKKTFSAGTEIIGPNDLTFTFNEDVSVASESAGPDYTKIPGKATSGVTAVDIGTEANLASGTEFSIANFSSSDFVARNDSAFTGGTSREIQVVAAEDQEKLLASLTEELGRQGTEQIKTKVPSGRKLLEESLKSSVVEKTFSKEVGEETNEISLSLKSKMIVLTYSEDELRSLITEVIEDKIPADFEFKKEESKMEFKLKEMEPDGIAIFEAKLSTKLIPQINFEEVRKNLVGKYPQLGKTYLDNLPNIVGTEIKITPQLPAKLLTFPRMAKNINIEVQLK